MGQCCRSVNLPLAAVHPTLSSTFPPPCHRARVVMLLSPSRHRRREVYLDDHIVSTVITFMSPETLSRFSGVSHALRYAVSEAASKALISTLEELACTPVPRRLEGCRVAQLACWRAVSGAAACWFVASEENLQLGSDGQTVEQWRDISGHARHAKAPVGRGPTFNATACAGQPALTFHGRSELQTLPFTKALPQPLTLMVVAKANGDTTLVDSLRVSSPRFELCHGYPPSNAGAEPDNAGPAITLSADGTGRKAPSKLLRGATRSMGTWHVYTAIYHGERSELYVDGLLEASGKTVGGGRLDGLRIGNDHTGTFFLRGAIAELRLFSCHLQPAPRAQLESALALRYGLTPKFIEAAAERSPGHWATYDL